LLAANYQHARVRDFESHVGGIRALRHREGQDERVLRRDVGGRGGADVQVDAQSLRRRGQG